MTTVAAKLRLALAQQHQVLPLLLERRDLGHRTSHSTRHANSTTRTRTPAARTFAEPICLPVQAIGIVRFVAPAADTPMIVPQPYLSGPVRPRGRKNWPCAPGRATVGDQDAACGSRSGTRRDA